MRQQQRQWPRPIALHMQEVQVDAVQRHRVLRKRVEERLLRPPVEAGVPVLDKLLEVGDIGSECPRLARRLVGKARACQPLAQIDDGAVRDVQLKGSHRLGHGPGLLQAFGAFSARTQAASNSNAIGN